MLSTQSSPPEPGDTGKTLRLCEHFDMLGASPVILCDRESSEIIHCLICRLSFHFITEGSRIIITRITPYAGEV